MNLLGGCGVTVTNTDAGSWGNDNLADRCGQLVRGGKAGEEGSQTHCSVLVCVMPVAS